MIYKITTPLEIDLEFKNDYDFSIIEVSIIPQHESVEFKKTKFILDASQLDDLIYIFNELKKNQNERLD